MACRRKGRLAEIVEDDLGRVGAGLPQGPLAQLPLLDDQSECLRTASHRFDQPRRRDVSQVPGDGLGLVGQQQLVEIIGVDPRQDQGLFEWHGVSDRLEDRTIQTDQGETFQAPEAVRLQRDRPVMVERSQGRTQVRRPLLQADEAQDRQGVGQRGRVARHPIDQGGDPLGVGEDQGQRVGVSGGDSQLRRRQGGDLGDQRTAVRLVGPFQAEILAPVQEHVGGGLHAQQVAEPVELAGILLIEEQGLHVELFEQDQPANAVGPLDRIGVPPESFRQPSNHLANARRSGAVSSQHVVLRDRLGHGAVRSVRLDRTDGGLDPGRPAGMFGLDASLISTPREARSVTTAKVRFIELSVVRGNEVN